MNTSMKVSRLVLAAFIMALPFMAVGNPLDRWTASHVVTNVSSPSGTSLNSVAFGNGIFLAVGNKLGTDFAMVQISEDGIQWKAYAWAGPEEYVFPLRDVAFGNGTFVAVGYGLYGMGGAIYSSGTGTNWSSSPSTIASFSRVTFGSFSGQGWFTAVGAGWLESTNAYSSPDGIVWYAEESFDQLGNSYPLSDVAYGLNTAVAVDAVGHVYTPSGYWEGTALNGAGNKISFCNDRFILSAGAGTNLISTDGTHWWKVPNNTGAFFQRVIYAHGTYLALSGTNLFTSTDTTNWTQRLIPVPSDGTLSSLAYGNGRFLIVGTKGSYGDALPIAYVCDPLVAVSLESANPAVVKVSGLSGRPCRIEQREDLESGDWTPAISFTLDEAPFSWTDNQATNLSRFYRAVLLP